MSRSPRSISIALFLGENHSVPVKKLPTRADGATGTSSGCDADRPSRARPSPKPGANEPVPSEPAPGNMGEFDPGGMRQW